MVEKADIGLEVLIHSAWPSIQLLDGGRGQDAATRGAGGRALGITPAHPSTCSVPVTAPSGRVTRAEGCPSGWQLPDSRCNIGALVSRYQVQSGIA